MHIFGTNCSGVFRHFSFANSRFTGAQQDSFMTHAHIRHVTRRLRHVTLALVACGVGAHRVAPTLRAQLPPPSVAVTGDVAQPLSLSVTQLAAMPRATVSMVNNGITTIYEGVWLADVLKKAGLPSSGGMRGRALSGYVLAVASDGYQVLFSMGELDADLTDGQYLLADHADGKPLYGENGAFRLVVLKDKRGARSVRMLSTIHVVLLKK